jgi:hypothetical protein
LVLATATVGNTVSKGWHSLLAKAIDADATQFPGRIATPKYASQIERKLFRGRASRR